jgi:protein O-mannosyl-transferase
LKLIRVERIILILEGITAGETMSKRKPDNNIRPQKKTGGITKEELISGNPSEIKDSGSRKQNLQLFYTALILSVTVLLTFMKSFDNEFVDWDDYTYVVDNNLVRNTNATTLKDVFSRKVSLNYHPLTILSLRLNNNKCSSCPERISAAPFIKWNVIIHVLNTLLVFQLIYILSKKKLVVAFIVAVLFGVHPMHVESVVWVSERKDVLYSFFFLSGLITYIKFLNVKERGKFFWYGATFILFLLSCLSKAMAVVFPLVLILIRFWLYAPEGEYSVKESIKHSISLKNMILLIPFFAASLFFGIIAITINNLNTFSFWHRIQFASYGFIMYIVKFFIPVNQAAIYPYPIQAELDGGALGFLLKLVPFAFIAVTGLVIYSAKKSKLLVFGLGFYFITVMMVLQFISVGVAIIADRYTYLAYIGLAFIPAMLIGEHYSKRQIPVYILSAFFVALMMILSIKQTKIWRNSDTLWSRVIELYPALETPRSLRGTYYSKVAARIKDPGQKKQFEDKALEDFRIAIRAGTGRADVLEGAGIIYGKRGDLNNSLLCLNNAIKLKPARGSAYFNRALTFSMLNKNDEAIKDYNMALIYSPDKAVEILTNRSNLFLITGKFPEAISDFNYLISKDNRNFLFYYNRAYSREQINDIPGAKDDYQKALQLQPDDEMTKVQLLKLLLGKK